jgi:hypothetical protein
MLANAAANPQSDATTVSLLTSYIFTPHLYISFSNAGTSSSQMSGGMVAPDVSPDLRASYFQTAATILLRPLPLAGQDQTSSGADGQYQMITRLLPLFEEYAPPGMTAALRAQLEVVAASASENARNRDNEWLTRGLKPEKPPVDQEQAILDQIDHVKTSAERDQLYLRLAFLSSDKGDVRARDYVDKIEEMELRKAAKAYIDPSLVLLAIQKKNADRALELGTSGELTHVQRSYLNAQVAKLLAKTNQERALALIEDAVAEARRIETSDADRPRAFFGAANALLIVDRPRVWELITDAVRASNSAEGFTGEDGQIVLRVISKGQNLMQERPVSDFDLKGIFQELAAENFEKAVDVARGFERVAPRANAVIAIARKILDQKNK